MNIFGSLLRFIATIGFLTEVLMGCMLGPNFEAPKSAPTAGYSDTTLPSKTAHTPHAGLSGKAQYFAAGQDIPAEWWELFHSTDINELVAYGLEHSPNLAAAKAALRQAQENLQAQTGSLLWPNLSGQVAVTRQSFSGAAFGSSNKSVFNLFNPAFNISYLLDAFGGSRRQIEGYAAQVDYQAFELEAAYLTLTSNIVTTAITAASFQAQISATRELIYSQEKTLTIIKKQQELGGASGSTVWAQETQLAQTRATLPTLEQALAQSLHVLAALIGTYPNSQLPILNLEKLRLPSSLPVSLPSRLAQQRPDIRASEALLHTTCAQVGVATANLFPQITLTGSYGWINDSPANLFSYSNNVWSIGGQIIQPIFYGDALRAKRRSAIAAFDQAAAQYQQTVIQAFQNVADVLKAIENDAKSLKAQKQAESSAKRNYAMLQKQLRLGGASYLELLNAQRQYQQSKINFIQAQAARYNDTVALFQALGGGWWNRDKNQKT
jgi:NodT family efflux transporter outer membrane factor (OMF) lipoprotein